MVRREQVVNNASTTLTGSINASVTSITVNNGSVFPSEGDYRLLIDSEVILVTARSGNDLTVVRGVDGTTAASHNSGVSLSVILTQSQLDKIIDDVSGGASAKPPYRLLDVNGNVLTTSDFSWVNQGTSSVADDASGSIVMTTPETTGGFRIRVKSAPSTPYTLTVNMSAGPGHFWALGGGTLMGPLFRESSTGELIAISYEHGNNVVATKYTNPTTFNSTFGLTRDADSYWAWMQIEDDGTDLFYRVSTDGINFFQLASEGRTAFMAGGPDQIGWFVSARGEVDKLTYLKAWIEE